MNKKRKLQRTVTDTKIKTELYSITETANVLQFFGIGNSVIDKSLFKKDKKVIEHYFDKAKTWLAIKSAGTLGLLVLLINTWWHWILSPIFIISTFMGFLGAIFANKTYNITFNTLLKKIEEETKKSKKH